MPIATRTACLLDQRPIDRPAGQTHQTRASRAAKPARASAASRRPSAPSAATHSSTRYRNALRAFASHRIASHRTHTHTHTRMSHSIGQRAVGAARRAKVQIKHGQRKGIDIGRKIRCRCHVTPRAAGASGAPLDEKSSARRSAATHTERGQRRARRRRAKRLQRYLVPCSPTSRRPLTCARFENKNTRRTQRRRSRDVAPALAFVAADDIVVRVLASCNAS